MFLRFDGDLSNDKFISVLITSFTRAEHVKNLVESIHQHADMPFEIIVIDDGSHVYNDAQDRIFNELRPKISTLILNCGVNMGLSASFNRGTALANGDIVLAMNDDTLMVGPAFCAIGEVLSRPYVGAYVPWPSLQVESGSHASVHVRVSTGGYSFNIAGIAESSSIFAFRKRLWFEIGGFPQVYHNGADVAFFHKLFMLGYFNGSHLLNHPATFKNVDSENGYPDATRSRTRFDSSYPKIFGVPDLEHKNLLRKDRLYNFSHSEYIKEFGLHNIEDGRSYFLNAKCGNGYNWELLKRFGQDKWKDLVDKDITAWGR